MAENESLRITAWTPTATIVVATTICAGHQVFYRCLCLGKLLAAKKTLSALGEQETIKMGGHVLGE